MCRASGARDDTAATHGDAVGYPVVAPERHSVHGCSLILVTASVAAVVWIDLFVWSELPIHSFIMMNN